jgi:hypothetical protein
LGADGREIPFDGWYEPGLGENIRLICNLNDIAVVFCSYVFQSRLLEFVPDHVLKVIDTHDKMGDRYRMLRRNGQPPEFFSCSPEQEGAYLRRADAVVARRAEEAEYFNSVNQRQAAIVIPHFEEPHFQERRFGAPRNVGLVLDDDVALKYFRIQQMTQGYIDLSEGEADPLKGPTDLGSGGRKDEEVGLADLVERLNERFGTSFIRADQLFFEQIRESAEADERIVEAALANKYGNFASYLERMLDELFIDRMDGNEEVFSKVMSDQPFRSAVHKGLARELYERIRAARRHSLSVRKRLTGRACQNLSESRSMVQNDTQMLPKALGTAPIHDGKVETR